MQKFRTIHVVVLLAFALCLGQAAPAHGYAIEKVKGNVYRFVADRHRSVFLVSEEGILVTDPMGPNAASWLNSELKKRFDREVRYVVYSHNHSDHIYGAQEFQGAGTTFVSHKLARQDILLTRAATVVPEATFERAMTVSLGDSSVELRYHGPNDGRGSISMLFLPERVLYVADWIVVGRMPWKRLWSYDIQGMINSTRQVLKLGFDTFVGAHAEMGTKRDVRRYLTYLEDLYAAVIEGVHAGKDLEQLQAQVKLDEYKDLRHYEEWLPLNIAGVYERLMEESGMGWRPDID
jgi:glyoxylase-like metal-dependent hydrolase (beta-lactamase superfamily II)